MPSYFERFIINFVALGREEFMHTISTAAELDYAINSIETLLNGKDGEFVLEAIKQYKEQKDLDQDTLLKLKQVLSF